MTIENTIVKYKFFVERSKQVVRSPADSKQVKSDLVKAEVLKKHMLSSKKYEGHSFLKELGVKTPLFKKKQ